MLFELNSTLNILLKREKNKLFIHSKIIRKTLIHDNYELVHYNTNLLGRDKCLMGLNVKY